MNSKTFIVIMLIITCGCTKNSTVSPEHKPDLTFGQITYAKFITPYRSVAFRFTFQVKNLGTTDLYQSFYVCNSRTDSDYNAQYCSHTSLVNDPPIKIAVGDSIELSFDDFVADSVQRVLFVINTNDRYDRGVPLPIIDELNYENNSATLVMSL